VSGILQPTITRVVEAAARKGVRLDITVLDDTIRSDEAVAALVGVGLDQIVKSLLFVASRPGGRLAAIVCLVSAQDRVDPGLLAAVAGQPSVRRATPAEARDLTGFPMGVIPPFGYGSAVRVVMDQALGRHQMVWATAGVDFAGFPVPPATLRALANAAVGSVTEPHWATSPALRLEPGSSTA
jgi:prolyl-tRNA editing enzyme YbaK/EbsC (Cys-tRNA(Pro) deacylase)